MAQQCTEQELQHLLDFVATPSRDEIVAMDCDENCGALADLAERVARGEDLSTLKPDLEAHFRCYPDTREEFEALVSVMRAQLEGKC